MYACSFLPPPLWFGRLLFQLVQMLQPSQYDRLARLFNLTGEEHLVQDGVDLVEIKDQVQLADVAEELVQHLDKEMYRLEVSELVVVCVDAGAEEQAGVAAIDDFGRAAELNKVGLVLLVSWGHEAMDLGGRGKRASQEQCFLFLLFVSYFFCFFFAEQSRISSSHVRTSPFNLTFSSSLYGAYLRVALVPLFSHGDNVTRFIRNPTIWPTGSCPAGSGSG